MYRIIHFENQSFTFVIAFSSNYFRNLSKFLLEYHMNLNLIHFLVSNHIFQLSLGDLNFHYHWNNCRFYSPLFPDPFVRRPRFFGFAGRAVFAPFREDKYPDCLGMILTAGIVVGFCIDWMNALNILRWVFLHFRWFELNQKCFDEKCSAQKGLPTGKNVILYLRFAHAYFRIFTEPLL